ncbi:MAG: hypothetical protein UZ16_OP3001002209 [Candidatus Hinthialibacteria bacterium OLB16]|nr:MAG: hypothetical protein UZ16_OP3001002209 [Candidatus Hinthialibacteria bacterium OLB16]
MKGKIAQNDSSNWTKRNVDSSDAHNPASLSAIGLMGESGT